MKGSVKWYVCFFVFSLMFLHFGNAEEDAFVIVRGTNFILDNKVFYVNGFNAYWMMIVAAKNSASSRNKVVSVFEKASSHGLNVARIWAFNDGNTYKGLQTSPGVYDETVFQALDFIMNEARRYGIMVILSFVNNYKDFGGRYQYVQWAQSNGANVSSDDDFYVDSTCKTYYKNHVKRVISRVNTFNGISYMDDPTVFAWELINEPRCQMLSCAANVQEWIEEMSGYVKSIDKRHLVEVGMEGFYGSSTPERVKSFNPGAYQVGTDYITNHQVSSIDFASVHVYQDIWLSGEDEDAQISFMVRWLQSHIEDAKNILEKPVVVAEFGKSYRVLGFSKDKRYRVFKTVYDNLYTAACNGTGGGAMFWQAFAQGMDSFADGYEIIFSSNSSATESLISAQSQRLSDLSSKFTLPH